MSLQTLDREGIKKLLLVYSRPRLAYEFGISIPTLRKYIRGREPLHAPVRDYINKKVREMLRSKPIPIGIFEDYIDDFANHRLSMDESQAGVYGRFKVLRYPIGQCFHTFMRVKNVLFVDKNHFIRIMERRAPDTNMVAELDKLGVLSGEDKFDRTDGSGTDGYQAMNLIFDLAHPKMSQVLEICLESAKREDPDQDGRVMAVADR
jgi:hypothetical protein